MPLVVTRTFTLCTFVHLQLHDAHLVRQARWPGCQGLTGVHAAAQDLHESITVKSLERMATCTVRVLPVHGQPLVFAGVQQPDLAVEVCIKQRSGARSDAYCTGRVQIMSDSADAESV